MTDRSAPPFTVQGEYAVVTIDGPLVQSDADWGGDSYDAIRARVGSALAADTKAVCLKMNSPGGDFAGCLELSRELRAMASAANKRLTVFTQSELYSAAYALAIAADEIVITPSAFVGSIGVWANLADQVEANKATGINYYYASTGERKLDRNPNLPISDGAKSELLGQVETMGDMFFAEVSRRRNISLKAIESLEGGVKFGRGAVEANLADRIVDSWNEYITGVHHMDEYMEALAKAAAGGDKRAARALAAAKDETLEDDKDSEPKTKAAAKAPDCGEDKAAALVTPVAKPAAVVTATPALHELAAQLHALQVKIQTGEETLERTSLLASRDDFSAEVKASLMAAPIGIVRDAVKTWPKANITTATKAAATVAAGSAARGVTQVTKPGDDNDLDEDDKVHIRSKMRAGQNIGTGVTQSGRDQEIGFMNPEQVRKAMAERAKKVGVV